MASPVENGFLPFSLPNFPSPTLRVGQKETEAQITLENANFNLQTNRKLLFDGNGQISAVGDLSFLTPGTPTVPALTIFANGNVGIGTGTSQPTDKLEIAGSLKLGTGLSINQFSDNITDSDQVVPTAKAVKTYVDNKPSPELPDGSVGTAKLANDAVTTDKIADHSITTAKIQNGAITQEKLHSLISLPIPNNSVGELQLANNAITTDKIADRSITAAKLNFSIPTGSSQWKGKDGEPISYSGNVGIGTTNPEACLHVFAPNIFGSIKLFPDDSQGDFTYDGGSDNIFYFTHTKANIPGAKTFFVGRVEGDIHHTSSRELKENIGGFSIQEALEALKGLNPAKFNYRQDDGKKVRVGFIAEDMPELLATPDRKAISSLDVVAVLTKVIQQQQEELFCLKERLNAIEARA